MKKLLKRVFPNEFGMSNSVEKQINVKISLYLFPAVVLAVISYYSTFIWLYERFTEADSYYSHGFLVPLVTVFFIWRKREKLRVLSPGYSISGLVLIVWALLLHILSIWTHIFFTSGFSILFLVFGLSLFLFGKEITKEILFPLFFLIFMLPLPLKAVNAFSFPLKMYVTKFSVGLVSKIGIPAFRQGFHIYLSNASLLIGNPCSGLRSLISFMALGAIFAYLLKASLGRRIFIFFLAIPIALFSNVIRVVALTLAANFWGGKTASPGGFFHDFSGIAVFVLGLGFLIFFWRLLEWKNLRQDT